MTHLIQRTALILLAGTALGLGASPGRPLAQTASNIPTEAIAAPGVDAAAKAKAATYTVRRGDTLAKIAARMGTSVETLARLNDLKRPYRLQPGQTIKGPGASAPARGGSKASTGSSARSSAETYTVKRGDTLFSISQATGVSIADLQAANGLGRSSAIMPGRKLKLSGGDNAQAAEDAALAERMSTARKRPAAEPEVAPPSYDRAAAGRVVTIEVPGRAYRVRKGDTLEKVARQLDSDVAELARINKLKRPYRLQPGQTLRGPGGSAKAYVVARGDTLGEVAQRFSTTVEKLRAANGLRRGASVTPGRRLRLPAGYRDRGPIAAPPPTRQAETSRPSFREPPVEQASPNPRETSPSTEGLPDRPQAYTPSGSPPQARPSRPSRPSSTFTPQGTVNGAPTASPPVSDAQISQMGRGLFQWPIRGTVLSSFGDKGTSQRNDGVNIRAAAGDPVQAAAAGEVVYAGDQVPGFGNLVLIKHADGWVTAYGHLSRASVRMQQRVAQGQTIGEAGSTGGVSEPQLHFEVRYAPTPQERARPVDPALVLPR